MKNILICTTSFDHKNIRKDLISQKYFLKFNTKNRRLNENELLDLIDNQTVGIISGTENISKKVLLKAKNLQVISRCGTGTDNIDKFALKKKIKIYTTDKEPVIAVAEFVVTQILSALKNSIEHHNNVKKKKWKKVKGVLLSNKKIGLIGYGKIGKLTHKLMKPFGCKFLIYDSILKQKNNVNDLKVLLKESDIITLNIPMNKKNKYFINKQKLNKMKDNVILVNCARGGLINEKALEEKLKQNKNFKVILDCFEDEPYEGNLLNYQNIILSPHVASYAKETRDLMECNSFLNCINNII